MNYSYKIVLLILNVVLAAVLAASMFFYYFFSSGTINWTIIAFTFCISFLSGLLLLVLITELLLKKINSLYSRVKNFRSHADENSSLTINKNQNEIQRLNLEISAWADDRKNEIERLKKLLLIRLISFLQHSKNQKHILLKRKN